MRIRLAGSFTIHPKMRRAEILACVLFATLNVFGSACAASLSNAELESAVRVAREISLYARQNSAAGRAPLVIGLGQSPSLVIAALQSLGEVKAINLPLSKFRARPSGWPGEFAPPSDYLPLSPRLEERLFEHFARYLPPEAEMNGSPIFLVDYCSTGEQLLAAGEYLEAYLKSRALLHPVFLVPVALSRQRSVVERTFASVPKERIRGLYLNDGDPFAVGLSHNLYDSYSEYGAYSHGADSLDQKRASRESYLALQEKFKSMLARNPEARFAEGSNESQARRAVRVRCLLEGVDGIEWNGF